VKSCASKSACHTTAQLKPNHSFGISQRLLMSTTYEKQITNVAVRLGYPSLYRFERRLERRHKVPLCIASWIGPQNHTSSRKQRYRCIIFKHDLTVLGMFAVSTSSHLRRCKLHLQSAMAAPHTPAAKSSKSSLPTSRTQCRYTTRQRRFSRTPTRSAARSRRASSRRRT
jgi:hypothetical protein